MGRPKTPDADKRRVLTFRLDNDVRQQVEALAAANGRSISGELEARLIATLGMDEYDIALLIAKHRRDLARQALAEAERAIADITPPCTLPIDSR